jgi:hypothetical protein
MRSKPSLRSLVLGGYIQFKGAEWIFVGMLIWWAASRTGNLPEVPALRVLAFYLIGFAVPGVLLLTIGYAARYRSRAAWYLSVAYLLSLVIFKAAGGVAELPLEAWLWVSRRVPGDYLLGVKLFGLASATVGAADLVALMAFLSTRGRECFGIGRRQPAR